MFHRCFTISALGLGILLPCALLFSPTASAHPLGNYSINHYTIFDLRAEAFRIHHMIDLAEIPSFREMDLLDVNLNGAIDGEEALKYLDKRVPEFLSNLAMTKNDKPLALRLLHQRLEVYEGSGNMPVFNIFLELTPVDWEWPGPEESIKLEFRSKNHTTARGYRESKVLLDGRYTINLGPWTDPELKYLTLVEKDENQNPIFQSFYNRFLLDLSPGTPQPKLDPFPPSADFSWTATARAEEDEAVLMATGGRSFTATDAPVSEAKPVVTEPGTADDAAENATPTPPSKVTVVAPTRTKEEARSEAAKKLNVPMLLLTGGIALALGMGFFWWRGRLARLGASNTQSAAKTSSAHDPKN